MATKRKLTDAEFHALADKIIATLEKIAREMQSEASS